MTTCKYDRDTNTYLNDGHPCTHDEYGDPTHHCTARRTCTQHIGPNEQTCARCLGRTRTDLRWIAPLAAIMPTEAVMDGVDSEAMSLAGPAADVRHWSARRSAMRSHLGHWLTNGIITETQYLHARNTMEDDDETHPVTVLTRWHMMIADHYGHPAPERPSVIAAAGYLDQQLHRIAQDPEQDFALLGRELRKCRQHLENVVHNSDRPDRGAPCPICTSEETGVGPRLIREYGHWCYDEDCDRLHYLDDSGDEWVCPRNRDHRWSNTAYEAYVEERQAS